MSLDRTMSSTDIAHYPESLFVADHRPVTHNFVRLLNGRFHAVTLTEAVERLTRHEHSAGGLPGWQRSMWPS